MENVAEYLLQHVLRLGVCKGLGVVGHVGHKLLMHHRRLRAEPLKTFGVGIEYLRDRRRYLISSGRGDLRGWRHSHGIGCRNRSSDTGQIASRGRQLIRNYGHKRHITQYLSNHIATHLTHTRLSTRPWYVLRFVTHECGWVTTRPRPG